MNKDPNEIADDEIRIISFGSKCKIPTDDFDDETIESRSDMQLDEQHFNECSMPSIMSCEPRPEEKHEGKKRPNRWRVVLFIAILIIGSIVLFLARSKDNTKKEVITEVAEVPEKEAPAITEEPTPAVKPYTTAVDTIINKVGLLILTPENARPRLTIGSESLNDSNIILATQAADIRGDNGKIAGTFVLNGELISKGEAKAGYCSIINGELSIGVADATPMLEQTLTDGGYFFRQYPLVVGGQIIENKPKGNAIRKALAEIGGKVCVIMSRDRLTFHDFSQVLIDAGVRNAIYLVGSSSYGLYVTESGEKIFTGKAPLEEVENVSYIVWEQM